jgi:hypothetical protein
VRAPAAEEGAQVLGPGCGPGIVTGCWTGPMPERRMAAQNGRLAAAALVRSPVMRSTACCIWAR